MVVRFTKAQFFSYGVKKKKLNLALGFIIEPSSFLCATYYQCLSEREMVKPLSKASYSHLQESRQAHIHHLTFSTLP